MARTSISKTIKKIGVTNYTDLSVLKTPSDKIRLTGLQIGLVELVKQLRPKLILNIFPDLRRFPFQTEIKWHTNTDAKHNYFSQVLKMKNLYRMIYFIIIMVSFMRGILMFNYDTSKLCIIIETKFNVN